MNQKWNIWLSLAAGLLGGLLSHSFEPRSVSAQVLAPAPKQIAAQSFVLVNDKGQPFGTLGFDKEGNASIVLLDKAGNVVWSQNGKPNAQQLAEKR